MQRKKLYKSISCAIAGIGLSMGAVQSANALSHALALATVSDMNVTVSGGTVGFSFVDFNTVGTATSSSEGPAIGVAPGDGKDLARTESGDYYAGAVPAGDENLFSAQALPGGAFSGAYVDTLMHDTFITGPGLTGDNVSMIAESATQGPPVPNSANAATSTFEMLWKFPAGSVADTDSIEFTGSMVSTLIEELLAPTTGGDIANAVITFAIQVGDVANDNVTFTIGEGIDVATDLSATFDVDVDDFDANGALDFNIFINVQANTTSNTQVPEPGSLALMGGGLLMLGAISRRRRLTIA